MWKQSKVALQMHTYHTSCAEQTIELAHKLGRLLEPNSIICLYGELGAGKTTFVHGLASSQAAADQEITTCSPTFQYLNIYTASPLQTPLYHFDLYRLEGSDAFLSMGFDKYLFAGGITCIEWPERILPIIPSHARNVYIRHAGGENRTIELPYCL